MNTNAQSCDSSEIDVAVSSGSAAQTQTPVRSPSNSTVRTHMHPAAYSWAAAVEAARCQPPQHRDPQVTQGLHHLMQSQHRGPPQRLAHEVSQGTTAEPGVARSLFGEPLSRAQLDRLFREEQQQVCNNVVSFCATRIQ